MKLRRIISLFLVCIGLVTAVSAAAMQPQMEYIVRLDCELPSVLSADVPGAPAGVISQEHNVYVIRDEALLEMLREEDLLIYAEPNVEITLFDPEASSDEPQADPWHLEQMNLTEADKLGCFGQGVRIAVIDSGVTPHPAFEGVLLPGYNYVHNTTDASDDYGHGTRVAGMIAAAYPMGEGTAAATRGVQIVPLKCFNSVGKTTLEYLCRAIYDAFKQYNCKILNMSFGMTTDHESVRQAINDAEAAGVLTVAAAGNDNKKYPDNIYYPAAYETVIGVGAVDSTSAVAEFSQRNESVFLTAPGAGLYCTSRFGDWITGSGTSFSTPLVCAVLARLLNVQDMTPAQARQLLARTAIDCGAEGYDTDYGHGLVNLQGAMEELLGDTPVFLSPAYDGTAVLSSLSEETVSAELVLASYENRQFLSCSLQPVALLPGSHLTVTLPAAGTTAKCFLWQSSNNPTPLLPCREYPVPSKE